MNIPIALVLGCNSPYTIGALQDWILEFCEFEVDFWQSNPCYFNEFIPHCFDHYQLEPFVFGVGIGYGFDLIDSSYNHEEFDGNGSGISCGYGNHDNGGNGYGYGNMSGGGKGISHYFYNEYYKG